jgi:H+-transporting ATPase
VTLYVILTNLIPLPIPRLFAADSLQIIIEEGQVVPADAHLICEYGNPNGFEEWQKSKHDVHADDAKEKKEGSEDDDDDDHHIGSPIVATDQSAITGESLAVDKYVGDTVFYTTGCKRGKAYTICLTTARTSFVGRTATLVQGAKDQGHFKAIMNSIGTALLVIVVAFIMMAWIGGFFRHLKIATPEDKSENLLHYVLILLIIGVPVGLPVVTTTTLAVGAAYLAKEKAIVQKLTAIESLAVRSSILNFHRCVVLTNDRVSTFFAPTKRAP